MNFEIDTEIEGIELKLKLKLQIWTGIKIEKTFGWI